MIFIKLLFSLLPLAHSNIQAELNLENGKSHFFVKGNPGFVKVNGAGPGPIGRIIMINNKASGEFALDLQNFKTGIGKRDSHLLEHINTKTYPQARLIIDEILLPQGWSINNSKLNSIIVDSILSFHGIDKPIQVEFSINEQGMVRANFSFDYTEFGIQQPSFMGVTVEKKVDINIESKLKSGN